MPISEGIENLMVDSWVSPSDAPILQPTLILRGAHDRAVSPGHASRLAALAPHHERVEVDAESHFIWFGRAAAEVWDEG